MFWRRKQYLDARVHLLEEREVELTAALSGARMANTLLAKRIEALEDELRRLLPPLRTALAQFQEFNRTY